MGEPLMVFQKTQPTDDESIFRDMGADLAKTLDLGVAEMVRYQEWGKLPIAAGAYPCQFNGSENLSTLKLAGRPDHFRHRPGQARGLPGALPRATRGLPAL